MRRRELRALQAVSSIVATVLPREQVHRSPREEFLFGYCQGTVAQLEFYRNALQKSRLPIARTRTLSPMIRVTCVRTPFQGKGTPTPIFQK